MVLMFDKLQNLFSLSIPFVSFTLRFQPSDPDDSDELKFIGHEKTGHKSSGRIDGRF